MEISDGNKIIMDFLGKEYAHWTFENRTSWISARTDLNTNSFKHFEGYSKLKYHKSFSWIIPVVEKIESLGFTVDIAHKSCLISGTNKNNFYSNPITSRNSKLEAVWLACVNFIYELK